MSMSQRRPLQRMSTGGRAPQPVRHNPSWVPNPNQVPQNANANDIHFEQDIRPLGVYDYGGHGYMPYEAFPSWKRKCVTNWVENTRAALRELYKRRDREAIELLSGMGRNTMPPELRIQNQNQGMNTGTRLSLKGPAVPRSDALHPLVKEKDGHAYAYNPSATYEWDHVVHERMDVDAGHPQQRQQHTTADSDDASILMMEEGNWIRPQTSARSPIRHPPPPTPVVSRFARREPNSNPNTVTQPRPKQKAPPHGESNEVIVIPPFIGPPTTNHVQDSGGGGGGPVRNRNRDSAPEEVCRSCVRAGSHGTCRTPSSSSSFSGSGSGFWDTKRGTMTMTMQSETQVDALEEDELEEDE